MSDRTETTNRLDTAAIELRAWRRGSMRFHGIVLSGTMLSIIFLYVVLHLFARDFYASSTKESMKSALQVYGVAENAQGQYELQYQGRSYNPTQDIAGDVGLGKMPAVKGYLRSVQEQVARANQDMRSLVASIQGAFAFVGERYRASAEQLGGGRSNIEVVLAGDPNSAEISVAGLRELKIRLERASAYTVPAAPVTRDHVVLQGAVSSATAAEVRKEIASAWDRKASAATVGFLTADGQSSVGDGLLGIAQKELGGFWLFGSWKYLEIVFFTMFGVMVEGLVRFGAHLVRRTDPPNLVWDPNETWRTGLKLLYAPITSVVAIWTLVTTDLMTVDVAGFLGASAVVSVAFVFGLFPNLPASLFKRLAEAIFDKTSVAPPPEPALPRATYVRGTSPGSGGPPSFPAFVDVAERHAVAPLTES